MTPELTVATRLNAEQIQDITDLITRVTKEDGRSPISEHVWLHLRQGGDDADQHVLAYTGDYLIGYAHLDDTDPVDGPSAELAVLPRERRHGVGRLLVSELLRMTGGRLRLWAHGEQAGSADLARSLGFTRNRVLWQMRRSLLAPLGTPVLPAHIVIEAFDPAKHLDQWLDVNRRAFAHLPDQGSWTAEDLLARLSEPWFDPRGFLIAIDTTTNTLCGFHWTKVHGHHGSHDPIGEIYVLGVDPAYHGHGLGRALSLAGLQYLRDCGLGQAMLYVEATNAPAISLYESLGFARWDTDVLYRSPTTVLP